MDRRSVFGSNTSSLQQGVKERMGQREYMKFSLRLMGQTAPWLSVKSHLKRSRPRWAYAVYGSNLLQPSLKRRSLA